ncbi:alpha/beta fold hydrolase [Caballeronia mineralivorans]|nr:alpha/beta hydrolase [Caballeronia mineralivorans]
MIISKLLPALKKESTMNEYLRTTSADALTPARFEAASFREIFRDGSAAVKGVRLHYVEGGSGAPVLLIPGWPQSWYAWRYIMPLLVAAGRRVIALDPRGMGDSDHPSSGYDMTSVAADVHDFVRTLGLNEMGPIDVVGHDVGTWISYAYASDWPTDVKRLAVLDAALPGITPPAAPGIPSAEANVRSWHFAFNRLDDLPEILIQGRERAFLTWLFKAKSVNTWTIGPSDLDEYVRVNEAPGALRSALAFYRAAFSVEGLARNRARAEKPLDVPVLALGAEAGVGEILFKTMQQVASNVHGGVIDHVGHYMPEECPRAVVDHLLRFFDGTGG